MSPTQRYPEFMKSNKMSPEVYGAET